MAPATVKPQKSFNPSLIPWVEKYRPKSTRDMVGFDTILSTLKAFISEFDRLQNLIIDLRKKNNATTDELKKKNLDHQILSIQNQLKYKTARILMGPSGVGKTTVVYALANDLHRSVIEMNASDVRSEEAINQKLRETIKSTNLLSFTNRETQGKLILIDEIDGIHGQSDKGGIQAIERIIFTSRFPIIMTSNTRDDRKFKAIYQLTSPIIELDPLKEPDIITILARIVQAEKLNISEQGIQLIAKKSNGDLRAAINDLQTLSQGNDNIELENINALNSRRDTETDLQDMLRSLFLKPIFKEAKQAIDEIDSEDVDYRTIHRWINENLLDYIPNKKDLGYAFSYLALVDRILGYILRTQDYAHLSYFYDLLAGGIKYAKSDKTLPKSKILPPRFFRIRATPEDEVALKLEHLFRVSLNDIMRELKPTLRIFLSQSPSFSQFLVEFLSLDGATISEYFGV